MGNNKILDEVDFRISVYKEMIPENGEDSYCYDANDNYLLMSVFDGCGGLGAKKYKNYSNKTGAYMASRAASGATGEWFKNMSFKTNTEECYKKLLKSALDVAKKYSDRSGPEIRGSMQKAFPTTLTSVIMHKNHNDGKLYADFYWAGDSRGYILDKHGLRQITDDDINGEDAMSNLVNDGVLANVVNHSTDFTVHKKTVSLVRPSLVFCATDGCFGYLSTPMNFEYLILECISESSTPEELEKMLDERIGNVASDDYSLVMSAVGFGGDYLSFKTHFEKRKNYMYENYIDKLVDMQFEQKVALWDMYKTGYYDVPSEQSL